MSNLESRWLEEDLPQLVYSRTFDLYTIADVLADQHSDLMADLADLEGDAPIPIGDGHRWLMMPGGRGLEIRNVRQQEETFSDARYLLAALITSRRDRTVSTIGRLNLGSLLERRQVHTAARRLIAERSQTAAVTALSLLKNTVVEYGVAGPFVAGLLKKVRRRTLDLLHESHLALEGFDGPPEEAMTTYVTEEILSYISADEEYLKLDDKPQPSHPGGPGRPKPPTSA